MKIVQTTPTEMVQRGLHTFFLTNLTLPQNEPGLHPMMRPQFEMCVNAPEKYDSLCLLAYDDENIPVAWALVFMKYSRCNIYMYVDPKQRRKGYGTALMNRAQELVKHELTVSKWSGPSEAFYSKFKKTSDSPYCTFTNEFDTL